jgi:hypothetical protein
MFQLFKVTWNDLSLGWCSFLVFVQNKILENIFNKISSIIDKLCNMGKSGD